ncbi:MAG TPA: hypothetical protein VGE43_19545 [Acidimicrobiales bacterium]
MSALPLDADDLAEARTLIAQADALVAAAARHIQAVREVQPRNRKGHLLPGAVNVWGVQNALTGARLHLDRAGFVIDRLGAA